MFEREKGCRTDIKRGEKDPTLKYGWVPAKPGPIPDYLLKISARTQFTASINIRKLNFNKWKTEFISFLSCIQQGVGQSFVILHISWLKQSYKYRVEHWDTSCKCVALPGGLSVPKVITKLQLSYKYDSLMCNQH